jgi:hypothetical protein
MIIPMSRALLLVVVVLLAACEGDLVVDEAATPAPEPAEAFVAQAEEICTGFSLELDPARREVFGDDPLEPADAQQTLERAGALLQAELEELRGLEPPPELAEEVDEWLAQVEAATLAYQEAGEAPEAAEALVASGDPMAPAEDAAEELGMLLCGTQENRRQDPTVEAEATP